jgi:hypothetical protein
MKHSSTILWKLSPSVRCIATIGLFPSGYIAKPAMNQKTGKFFSQRVEQPIGFNSSKGPSVH